MIEVTYTYTCDACKVEGSPQTYSHLAAGMPIPAPSDREFVQYMTWHLCPQCSAKTSEALNKMVGAWSV